MMMRRSGTLSVISVSQCYDDEKKWDLVCDQVSVL